MEQTLSMRLDNASNIYPAGLTKKYASIYRMSISLCDPINVNILQQALLDTVKRIPTFGCTLKNGFFWWKLKSIDKAPAVSPYSGMNIRGFHFHGGFLFKVMADGNRIVLDVFHAIADGRGGQTFLLTLAGEYIRMRYKTEISYNNLVLNTDEAAKSCEYEDGFRYFSGKKGALEQNELAYHVKGHGTHCLTLHGEKMEIEASRIKAVSKEIPCTITDYITATMLDALQEEHRHDRSHRKRNVLKVNVPVDLRNIFEGRTLRNYSSYVNIGIDVSNGYYSFEDLLKIVVAQKSAMILPSELEKKIAANVSLEDNMAIAIIPLFIKHIAIDIICRLKGDRYCSQTISNLGNVVLPEEMMPYVTDMEFVLGRQRSCSGAASCVGFNGKLNLVFTRNIRENSYESYFAEKLREHGVPVNVSSEDYGVTKK